MNISKTLTLIFTLFFIFYQTPYSQNTIYVDDDAAPGGDGSMGSPYQTIQEGIDNATSGDTIDVAEGTYVENVLVDKSVVVLGAPDHGTNIRPSTNCSGAGVTISSSNVSLVRLDIRDFTTGVELTGADHTYVDSVAMVGNCTYGFYVKGTSDDLEIVHSSINNTTNVGFRVNNSSSLTNVLISDSELNGNRIGVYLVHHPNTNTVVDSVNITNTTFNNNSQKGFYAEKLSNAIFDNITVHSSGTDPGYGFNNGIDINLKWQDYKNITIQHSTITDCGYTGTASDSTNPAAIAIKARDDGSYGSPPATLDSVFLYNNTISGPVNGVRFGEFGKVNTTPMNVTLEQNDLSHDYDQYDVINNTDHDVTLICNWHGTTNQSEIEDGLLNNGSANIQLLSYSEDASFSACTPLVLNMDTGEEFMTIQAAIDDADTDNGDLIKLSAWDFEENVTVDKGVEIQGAGKDQTTVYPAVSDIGGTGPPSFGNSQIFVIEADDVTLTQMTIDGDNPNLTSGAVINGADVDARNGVITNYTKDHYDGLVVHDARVQNIFLRAVYATGSGPGTVGNEFYNNEINNADSVLVNSCGICLFNARGEVWNNSLNKSNTWSQYSKGVSFHDNTITGGKYAGILSQNNGRYPGSSFIRDSIYNNTVQQTGFGIYVINPVVDTVFVQNNTLTDNGYGISGTGSSSDTSRIVFENNTVSNSAGTAPSIGGEMDEWTGEAHIVMQNNNFTDLDTGLIIIADHNNTINVQMDGDAFNSITENYVHMKNPGGGTITDIDGSTVLFNGEDIGPDNFEAIEMKVYHEVDDPNLGLFEPLPPCTGPEFVINTTMETVHCSIQAAVDNASSGDTIELLAEDYEENVTVDKSLYIQGAGKDQTTVYPAVSDIGGTGPPSFGNSQIFVIEADDVTLTQMTIDGDNPNLTSGAVINGADVDARNGVITNYTKGNYDNLVVHHARVQNIFLRAVYATGNGSGTVGNDFYDNEINNADSVLVNSCGICLFNAKGEVWNNSFDKANTWSQYSKGVSFHDNTITGGKYAGILSQNNGRFFPGPVDRDSIFDNTVQQTGFGIYVINPVVDSIFVQNNTLTDNGYGISGTGSSSDTSRIVFENNTVSNSAGTAPSIGGEMDEWTGEAHIVMQNNSFTDLDTGLIIIADHNNTINVQMDGDAFNGITEDYVHMKNPGGGTITDIDGSTVLFNGEDIGPDNNQAIEDKIYHAVDDSKLGLFMPLPYCPDIETADFAGGANSFCFNDTAHLTIDFLDTADYDFEGNVTVEFTVDNASQGNYSLQPITLSAADWRSTGVDIPLDVTDLLGNNSFIEAVITTDDNCQTNLNESQIANLLPNKDFTVHPTPQVGSATFGGGAMEFCYGNAPNLVIDFDDNAGNDLSGPVTVDLTIENTEYGTYDPPAIAANASTWRSSGVAIALNVPAILGENTMTAATITTSNNCETTLTESEISSLISNSTFTVVPIEGINCPSDIVISCDESQDPQHTGMATVDNCIDTFELTYSDVVVDGECPQSDTIFRTWTASDTTDYSVSCTQTITIVDEEGPVMNCPENNVVLHLDQNGEVDIDLNALNVSATDNCGAISYSISESMLTCADLGLNDITVEATDECGNASDCVVTVDIRDNLPPDLNCPPSETKQAGGNCSVVVPDYQDDITVSDNCGNILNTYQQPLPGSNVSPGVHDITITVWDESTNSSTCVVTLTVVDNTPPNLSCPEPDTIQTMNCTAELPDYRDQNDVTDNCQNYVPLQQNPTPNTELSEGTHSVTITATDDEGNSTTCTFDVTIQGSGDTLMIECPADDVLTADVNCLAVLPDYTDDATVFDDCSDNASVSQHPPIGTNLSQGVHTVSLMASNNAGESDTCTFEVTVTDEMPPALTCPSAQTLSADGNCEAVLPDWTGGAATDNCDNDPSVTQSPAPGTTVAKGLHTITLTATDIDGNSSTCSFTVDVVDDSAPNANCMDISITVQEGNTYTLDPAEVDGGSSDNCGINSMSVAPNTFDCNDEGTNSVILTVVDGNGNSSNCSATVTVDCELASYDLSGNVSTDYGESVEDVTIDVTGSSTASTTTDTAGDYSVTIGDGTQVTVTPSRDTNPKAGVSTVDLIAIQLHLIDLVPLSTPEQLIAADATNDGQITTADLVQVQLMLIGLTDGFPNNESWRFVRADYVFPNPMDPWQEAWPEDTTLYNLNGNVSGLDFTGIKIGDVNNSYSQFKGGASEAVTRSGKYHLRVPQKVLNFGEEFTAWFYTDEVDDLKGYQASFRFNPYALEFKEIILETALEDLKEDNFNAEDAEHGLIHLNYYNAESESFMNPEKAFGIRFEVLRKGENRPLSQIIALGDQRLEPEAYIKDDINGFELQFFKDRSDGIILHSNRPNPFTRKTDIIFELSEDEKLELSIFDENGKLFYKNDIEGEAGHNRHPVNARDWPQGLYYYELRSSDDAAIGKMILQR